MRPLLDTNVMVDVALQRPGLHEASGRTLAWCVNNPGTALVAVHSLATLSYLAGRAIGRIRAREFLRDLAVGIDVARVDNAEVQRAFILDMADFEDALVASAAESAGATHIVTRNVADFRRSPVKAVSPESFVRLLSQQ
jgi:predicted nucleic acid-binding protein